MGQGTPTATTSFPALVQGMRKGCPTELPREGGSSLSPGVFRPSCQVLPHPLTHTPFSQGPGPGQEAWWRLEGGGLSNPQLLKRASGEVKIGNKNKIAAAALVVCVGNKASPGPAGRAQLRPLPRDKCPPHQPLAATRTSTSNPEPRAGSDKEGSENQVRIPAVPITSHVTVGKLRPLPVLGLHQRHRYIPTSGTTSLPQQGCPILGLPHTLSARLPRDPPHTHAHLPQGGQLGEKSPTRE